MNPLLVDTTLVLLLLLFVSGLNLAIYIAQLRFAIATIGHVHPKATDALNASCPAQSPLVSVIVPAYNEANNIHDCITSILNSTSLPPHRMEVWVVDDQSTDETWAILTALQQQLQDARLHLLSGLPRPDGETWTGKNWACAQAADRANGEFLIFIDADVRLKPGAIATVIPLAQESNLGLLNCIPEVNCGSLIEWLVQPLIFTSLLISLAQPAVRDPNRVTAYAAGPFLLFRRSAYEKVGGHRAVAHEVAEDVALARAIKHHQLKLDHRLGSHLASLRMYTSWATLWEGWTKVLYVGAWRSIGLMVLMAVMMISLYAIPLLGLGLLLVKGLVEGWSGIDWAAIALSLLCLALHYTLRSHLAQALNCPPKYWWLQGIGGVLVAIMAIASIIKAETGWGWTWRGRSLALGRSPQP